DEQVVRIGDAAVNSRVDGGHQVVEVAVRIGLVDAVGEGLAVTGRTAGVGVQDCITGGGVELIIGREVRAVGGVGAAVNLQDQRHALARLVGRRKQQPRGHTAA